MKPLTTATIAVSPAPVVAGHHHATAAEDGVGGIKMSGIGSILSSRSTEEICAITHEAISDIPTHNRFLAADGKVYDKEALKQWLMVNKAAASPYMICSLLSDVPKLWPELNLKAPTPMPRYAIISEKAKVEFFLAAELFWYTSVASSLSMLIIAAISMNKNTGNYNTSLPGCANFDMIVIAATGSYLGLSTLGAGAYYLSKKVAQKKLANAGSGRSLTAEEWATIARDSANFARIY